MAKLSTELEGGAERYTDLIFDSMHDALWVVAHDSTIERVNQALLDLLGYEEPELLGAALDVILVDDFGDGDAEWGSFCVLDPSVIGQRERELICADGRRVPVLFSGAIARSESGDVESIVCVASDITALRQAERERARMESEVKRAADLERLVEERTCELQTANKLLASQIDEKLAVEAELRMAQKLEAIGQLSAGIAHEINTPMQYIGDNTRFLAKAFSNVLESLAAFRQVADNRHECDCDSRYDQAMRLYSKNRVEFLVGRVPRAIETTIEGVVAVSGIVRSMKDFSHMASDDFVSSDIHAAIEATVTICRNEWKYVATVVTELVADQHVVLCLVGELKQVFLNIIVNAAHAISDKGDDEKGTIGIRTQVVGERLEIAISDSGSGIPEPLQPRVFDPFFTTKEVGRGTGQGLAIAWRIVVDKHHGTLSFETEAGQGTTFLISLPLIQPAANEDLRSPQRANVGRRVP